MDKAEGRFKLNTTSDGLDVDVGADKLFYFMLEEGGGKTFFNSHLKRRNRGQGQGTGKQETGNCLLVNSKFLMLLKASSP